jgi:hypothetical protein
MGSWEVKMKTIHTAPLIYYLAATLTFILVMLLSAVFTTVLASSPVILRANKSSIRQGEQSSFLPMLKKAPGSSAIIIDHTSRDIAQVPSIWIQAAMQNVVWSYGSTSHGTQVWTGADYLSSFVDPPTYNFLKNWVIPPDQGNPAFLRMGYDSGISWNASTFLDTGPGFPGERIHVVLVWRDVLAEHG